MKCTNCGVELEEEARYCQDCGFPVPGTGSSSIRPIDAATASGRAKRSRRAAIIVGVLSVIAVAVVIAAAVMLLGGKGSSGTGESESASAADTDSSFASEAADEADSSAASSSASSSSKSSKAKKTKKSKKKKFVQADAEAKARKKATNAGMQLFSGTLHITTYGDRIKKVNSKMASSFASVANQELAILDFSMDETVYATYYAGGDISAKTNQACIALTDIDKWREFDGQLIVVATYPGDLCFPNNAAEALYTAIGGAILIAPLNEDRAAALAYEHSEYPYVPDLPTLKEAEKSAKNKKDSSDKKDSDKKSSDSASSSAASAGTSNSYMLSDSASRTYSKSELKKLSDYELFIARNEIYARHGRIFQSEELKDYFGSKSWYKGTVAASDFNESVLNAEEKANATLIREIEESRGSKYL